MKKVKILAALAALMTLGLAACTDTPAAESVEATSAAATSQAASANTSKAASASSSKASSSKASSSKSTGPDYTQVLPRTWTDGTPAANADGKNYIPMTDSTANKVGVKIAITDWTKGTGAHADTALGTDGKIAPGNEHTAILAYKVKAAKAGDYQMIMTAKSSSSGDGKTMSERYFTCKLNGAAVDVGDDRAPLTTEMAQFVVAPTIHLTGNEDTIEITAADYRPVFDTSSFVIFSEH